MQKRYINTPRSPHTIPNGDPPEPFAPNTQFVCVMLEPPITVDPEFFQLDIDEGKSIGNQEGFLAGLLPSSDV